MNMNKQIHIGLAILAAAFITSGCVSTGTHEKMQATKNEEIATLQKEKAAVEKQKATLEQDNAALKQQNMAVQQQVGTLEHDKAALIAANERRRQQYNSLVQSLAKEVEKGQLKVRQYQNMLSVDLADQVFFDSGRATLKTSGKDVLKKVAEALKGYENKVIRVAGHTDNVPVAKILQDKFPSNWELSVARATTVVRFFQDSGIPPERLIASGRGEYEPVASNDSPEGRQKNRRIEIMLIDQSLLDEMSKSRN
jgi:chemotaxis protein MotB